MTCIGGGPAGLYLGILLKARFPAWPVHIYERNRPLDTFGWGVVFSDATLENLRAADEPTQREITQAFAHWDDIEIHFEGHTIRSSGHGFCGISRKTLLAILQRRAAELGVELHFEHEIADIERLRESCDLLVGADGGNSRVRQTYADAFHPVLAKGRCRFVWLGTTLPLDAFTFIFERTEHGWFTVHAYRFDDDCSTFIVECREETWLAHGLDAAGTEQTIAFCEKLFEPYLHGHRLMANSAHLRGRDWLNFTRVGNERWTDGNVVLVGDAAHTAHFSVGSGTKLAMEDAIGLADALVTLEGDLSRALPQYEAARKIEFLKLQNAARNSTEWFENVARYATLPPEQFAYSLLTRSQRIGHENLRLRDTTYVGRVEGWFGGGPIPPMFVPFRLRELELRNRVVVSPMDMYSAVDGTPNDFHLVHLGSRALGGAGLVFTEMTCVTREGRISPGCTGMYLDEHVGAWRRIVDFVHERSGAKICLQLGHSGPKGSTKLMWEGMDEPLDDGNWPLFAPSAIPYAAAQSSARGAYPRADGRDSRCVRARRADGARSRLRYARAALRPRLSALVVHHPAAQPAYRRVRRLAGEPSALSARSLSRDARRLAARAADVGANLGDGLGRGRNRRRCRGRDRARLQRRRRRSDRRLRRADVARCELPCTDACSRRRTRTRFATRSASRRWPSGTSPIPIKSTPSSRAHAPIWSRWDARIWPIRSGRCTPRRSSAMKTRQWPVQYVAGKEQLERLIARARETA